MPAPHRRNKGESLAHQIKAKAGSKAVSDDRDNLVATRVRKDAKWQEAAAVLSPAMQRVAKEVKRAPKPPPKAEHRPRGHEKRMRSRRERAKPPVIVLTGGENPRYFLGECLGCNASLWVHNAKLRVPLCPSCREKRS